MSEVTVGAALRRVKKLKGEIAEISQRAAACVRFDKSAPPAYEFEELIKQRAELVSKLIMLEASVAVSNATRILPNKLTAAATIRTLQEIKGEIAFIRGLATQSHQDMVETSKNTEYREVDGEYRHVTDTVTKQWTCRLPEREKNEKIAKLQKKFDELNEMLEAHNHKTFISDSGVDDLLG